jgi:hypothetical protein
MIFFIHFAHPPECFFTYSQAGKAFRSLERDLLPLWNRIITLTLGHQKNQWRFPAMARDSSGTNPSPKLSGKSLDIADVNGVGEGKGPITENL